ncbi:YjbQ family protein [bacterium]|nr:YjbQ family protein [bacterium]
MSVATRRVNLETQGNCDIRDITGEVRGQLRQTGMKDGAVTIFVPGATGGVTTVEFEDGLVRDLKELFDSVAPEGKRYYHDERWHDGNGHSHVRASLLGPSLTVPFCDGELILGTWQQIVFVDFDTRRRSRRLVLQFIGE